MKWIVILLALLLALGWWQRDRLVPALHLPETTTAKSATTVYQWRDAQGRLQMGDTPPPGAKAQAMVLKPLTVIQHEALPASKPGAAKQDVPATPCEQEAPQAMAQCVQQQATARNLAIERMEASISK